MDNTFAAKIARAMHGLKKRLRMALDGLGFSEVTTAVRTDDGLRLKPKAEMQVHQLERQREDLLAALEAYGAGRPALDILPPRPYRPEAELIEEFSRRPELQDCLEVLNARVKGCRPADDEG